MKQTDKQHTLDHGNRHTPEQSVLLQIGKMYRSISWEDAKAYVELAREVGFNDELVVIHNGHSRGNSISRGPHLHPWKHNGRHIQIV